MSSTVVRLAVVTFVIFSSSITIVATAIASADPNNGVLPAAEIAARRRPDTTPSRVALATSEPVDAAVRTVDRSLAGVLAEAALTSPTFQRLLDRLRASDVVVYVQTRYELPSSMDGHLTFMGTGGNRRYVRVSVGWGRSAERLIATLAHELQHAVEVAERSDIVDSASLARAFEQMGRPNIRGITTSYETDRAIETGARVLAEVTQVRRSAKGAPELEIRP